MVLNLKYNVGFLVEEEKIWILLLFFEELRKISCEEVYLGRDYIVVLILLKGF